MGSLYIQFDSEDPLFLKYLAECIELFQHNADALHAEQGEHPR